MTIACIQAELYNKKRPQNELYNEDLTVKKRSFFLKIKAYSLFSLVIAGFFS